MKMKNLFKSKEKRLKEAFRAIKADMDFIEHNHEALKESANEWIMFLDQENRDLKMRLMETEKKLEIVENALDEERLSILRAV